jgi:hypothetical protein
LVSLLFFPIPFSKIGLKVIQLLSPNFFVGVNEKLLNVVDAVLAQTTEALGETGGYHYSSVVGKSIYRILHESFVQSDSLVANVHIDERRIA